MIHQTLISAIWNLGCQEQDEGFNVAQLSLCPVEEKNRAKKQVSKGGIIFRTFSRRILHCFNTEIF